MTLTECLEHLLRDPATKSYHAFSQIPKDLPFTEISDSARLCPAPLVSVLMRAYNVEKTIGRAIESVVTQQTDFPFELVIADDASTDGTIAVCREWLAKHPNKIRILRAHKNGGLSINTALMCTHARGDWLAECDSDDYWLTPHKLQCQLDLVRRHNAVLCVSNFFFEDVRDGRRWSIPMPDGDIIPPTAIHRYYFQTTTLFYSRAVYERMAREIPLPMEGDSYKPQLFARYGRIVYWNEVASIYFVGEGTWSRLSDGMKAWFTSCAYIGLHLYGLPALRRTYARLALNQIRLALHPKKGLTQAEYDARRDLLWAIVRHLLRRLHFSPQALLLALKIRARAKHLRNV